MPWLDQQRIAAVRRPPYWFSVWAVMLPNLFIVGSFVAVVAALTRSLLASYTVLVAIIIADIVVGANTDQETIARMSLVDPFGRIAFGEVTRYWTVFDQQHAGARRSTGTLLTNRLIWLSVAGVALVVAALRFSFAPRATRVRRAARRRRRSRHSERGRTAARSRRCSMRRSSSNSFCRRSVSICAACSRATVLRDADVRHGQRRQRILRRDFAVLRHAGVSGDADHAERRRRQLRLHRLHDHRLLHRRTRASRARVRCCQVRRCRAVSQRRHGGGESRGDVVHRHDAACWS